MITADYHIHTSLSEDSTAPMEEMIEQGIRAGLTVMCFTEHMDKDYPGGGAGYFEVDTKAYRERFLECRAKYADRIELLFGIELGLSPDLAQWQREYTESWPFDFVIGSSHLVHGEDPYYPEFYKDGEEEGYRRYFESVRENLEAFSDIDTYGHIDYVVRYGPDKNKNYTYEKYRSEIDSILTALIDKKIALEVNTGGYKYGLGEPNPAAEVIKRYRELGGSLITVGSDAHEPQYLAYEFERAGEVLRACGFGYYTQFRGRVPEQVRL